MATTAAKRAIARRVPNLDEEIALPDARLSPAVSTAGDNPERLNNDVALAHLGGIRPPPASSGAPTGTG